MLTSPPLSTFRVIFTSFLLSLNLGFCLLPTQAQVVSDPTLDSNVDRIDDRHLVITGGQKAGQNLFHSFSEFSVPSNSTVHFDNNENIENIFSRVTGSSISNIDGLIKANGNASLFLLNPAGILFGPNAQLDLGGSFIATTAEAIAFPNGIEFSAVNTESQPVLTVNIPIGLQYGKSPGSIITQGVSIPAPTENNPTRTIENPILNIQSGNTLALVGGEVSLELTRLNTVGGRAEIGSVSGEEFVALQTNDDGWAFNYERVNEFSQVEFLRSSVVSGDGGSIHIQAKDINLNNTQINNSNLTEIDGGNVNLIATNTIVLDRSVIFTTVGDVNLDADLNLDRQISGDGGDISLQGNRIVLSNGSAVSAETLEQGNGGKITIEGKESVELSGQTDESGDFLFSSLISTSTAGEGDGGRIEVNTKNLSIRDGGQIQANSSKLGLAQIGAAGEININATESIELSGTEVVSSRNPETGEITNTIVESGISASSGLENIPLNSQSSGRGGNLTVNTPQLLIENGAKISVSNFGNNNAGDIEIKVGELNIKNKGEIVATTASGLGGEINLGANSIILENEGLISARADNNGNGGNINITTDTLVLFDRSRINADADRGRGGNIQINTQGLFVASEDREELITASSQLGIDGEVTINTPDVGSQVDTTLLERSPLAVENLIYTGCSLGKNYTENRFNYIGRGGLPLNPMEKIATEDLMVDLGKVELPKTQNQINRSSIFTLKDESYQEIREATNWIINQKGNIELTAPTFEVAFLSACQLNSYR